MKNILDFFEQRAFGVCSYWGEKLGVSISSIRLFFIYTSFITFGSPLLIYLSMVFVMNMHKHLRRNRKPIWDF
jgi:phage shock protein PspC (stress-responsive transcriptional regulator)